MLNATQGIKELRTLGKKMTQFRFEEDIISDFSGVAVEQGIKKNELVRNALRLYISLYGRMKVTTCQLFLKVEKDGKERREVILPWIP